jgi:hypothetical protein
MVNYKIEYLDTNGVTIYTTIPAISDGHAEDVFCETHGEQFEIVKITVA